MSFEIGISIQCFLTMPAIKFVLAESIVTSKVLAKNCAKFIHNYHKKNADQNTH